MLNKNRITRLLLAALPVGVAFLLATCAGSSPTLPIGSNVTQGVQGSGERFTSEGSMNALGMQFTLNTGSVQNRDFQAVISLTSVAPAPNTTLTVTVPPGVEIVNANAVTQVDLPERVTKDIPFILRFAQDGNYILVAMARSYLSIMAPAAEKRLFVTVSGSSLTATDKQPAWAPGYPPILHGTESYGTPPPIMGPNTTPEHNKELSPQTYTPGPVR